jgi:3-isopropylmalate dehydrogenase
MRAKFCLLPGDGIGPEVTTQGVKALQAVADIYGHQFDFEEALIGGIAIDATGSPLPEATIEACRRADAVILGAVGGPKWSDPRSTLRPEQGLLRLRQEFTLFANLRPVRTFDGLADMTPLKKSVVSGTDILFVRELTGGLYFGARQETRDGSAWDTLIYTEHEVERVARVAFESARGRRKKVTSIDKANVLASSRLWRTVVERVSGEYSDVTLEHLLVDAATMHLLTRPRDFDVILAGNLFGDILSDEASVLAGSLGMLPSASLNGSQFGVYEPVHGSAPDIAGQNAANPTGMLASCSMALRHSLGLEKEARYLEQAIEGALETGARTRDLDAHDAFTTSEFAERVLSLLPTPMSA